MKQDYFVYNNIRYEAGTIVLLSRFDLIAKRLCNVKAEFLYYDNELNEYYFDIYGKTYPYTEEHFKIAFRGIYNPNAIKEKKEANTNNTQTFEGELNIDGMFIAWIWYIFIMAVAVIFYDRIGIWILASIVFFYYRSNKLKEAGRK